MSDNPNDKGHNKRLFWLLSLLLILIAGCAGNDVSELAQAVQPTALPTEAEATVAVEDGNSAETTQSPTAAPTQTPVPEEPVTLTTDLGAHFLFSGNADDASSNGNHGTPNGEPTFIADRFGNPNSALQFDGVDDYIAIEHDASYAPTSRLTLSAWFFYQPQPSASTYYTILEKSDPERGGHSRWGLWTIGNQAEFCIQAASVQFHYCLDTIDGLVENGWNHIVGSWDIETLTLFLNGREQVSKTYGRDGISLTQFELFIGTDLYNDSIVYTAGAIDDVRIYRRALSAEEVAELHALESEGMVANGEVGEGEEAGEVIEPIAERVVIAGADGLEIVGDFQSEGNEPQPGVLLLHMLNNRRQSWEPLVPELLAAGYAVLAIDMRGHGETGGAQDWTLAEQDLQLVFDWLQARPEVDAAKVAIVGASIGANMAIRTAANDTEAAGVIMLSGGLDYRGVTTEDALQNYGNHPVLIVAAEGDGYAKDSAETLHTQQSNLGNTELIIYDGGAHGTSLFAAQPDIISTIISWLNKIVR